MFSVRTTTIDVRALADSDLPDWLRALNTGFLRAPAVTDDEVADRRTYMDVARMRGAFDEGRCVATYRSFPQELTVPGGARLADPERISSYAS